MPTAASETVVHPTADVHPSAVLEEGVRIEALACVGPRCRLGPGTRLRRAAIVVQDTSLGANNDVHPFAVLGGDPQDRAFNAATPGALVIGDGNIFREHSSVSRSTVPKGADPDSIAPTRIGSRCMFMTGAHAGHNAQVGDDCVLANGACLAGHARIGSRVTMSAFAVVHQFTRVGDLVMFQGYAGASMHVPPFVMLAGVNGCVGLNRVGLRRTPTITQRDREGVRRVFSIMYRDDTFRPVAERVAECESLDLSNAARAFVQTFRSALDDAPPWRRGVVPLVRGGSASRARRTLAPGDDS